MDDKPSYDELAAHVDRLLRDMNAIANKCVVYGTYPFDGYSEIQDIAVDALNGTAEQSLNHIKAQVEEEIIERCITKLQQYNPPQGALAELATMPRKYSNQSETVAKDGE